jgi:hypothetical protein
MGIGAEIELLLLSSLVPSSKVPLRSILMPVTFLASFRINVAVALNKGM